jgi:hypothetical protein
MRTIHGGIEAMNRRTLLTGTAALAGSTTLGCEDRGAAITFPDGQVFFYEADIIVAYVRQGGPRGAQLFVDYRPGHGLAVRLEEVPALLQYFRTERVRLMIADAMERHRKRFSLEEVFKGIDRLGKPTRFSADEAREGMERMGRRSST